MIKVPPTAKKRLKKFHSLNWKSPSKRIPHGISGLFSLIIGIYLVLHSITGNYKPYYDRYNTPILLYVASTIINAIGGLKMSHLAGSERRGVFKRAAILQICLSYHVLRFTPQITQALSWLMETMTANKYDLIATFISASAQILDILFALTTALCTLSFHNETYDFYINSKNTLCIAISIGVFGILLLSVYPMHLAILGQEWWECIQTIYPLQAVGMVGYIYVPASVTFSAILFSATLYLRKIITEIEFGLMSAGIVVVCLVGTVLCQEVYIPDISTQRIYLPCIEPEDGSLEGEIVKALDFSRYARIILSTMFNVKFDV